MLYAFGVSTIFLLAGPGKHMVNTLNLEGYSCNRFEIASVHGDCPDGPNPPAGYSDYDDRTATFYRFEDQSMKTFPAAKADCESEGAKLFMGKTQDEWDFVINQNGNPVHDNVLCDQCCMLHRSL